MAGQLNLECRRGDTYVRTFTWRNSAGTPYNLTGYTAKMQLRTAPDAGALYTFENSYFAFDGVNGSVTVTLPATETAAFEFDILSYDIEIRNPNVSPAFVKTLVAGEFRLIKDITLQ